jgi:hypothetical protein
VNTDGPVVALGVAEPELEDAITTFKKTLLFASMFVCLAACGPGEGSPSPGSAAVDGGACGAINAGAAGAELLGNWSHGIEADSCLCNDGNTFTNSTAGTALDTFAAGACGQVVITSDLGCSLTCQISASTVTCAPGTCEYDGITVNTTSDVYSVVNGQLVQETATGVMTLLSGTACQCTTTNAAFTRVE